MLTSLALAAVLAAAAPAAPQPVAVQPISVQVEAAPKGPADLKAYADELRAALLARKDEFRATKTGEKPELRLHLVSLAPTPDGKTTLRWDVLRAGQAKSWTFIGAGSVRQQAELLARNMRKVTDPLAAPAARK